LVNWFYNFFRKSLSEEKLLLLSLDIGLFVNYYEEKTNTVVDENTLTLMCYDFLLHNKFKVRNDYISKLKVLVLTQNSDVMSEMRKQIDYDKDKGDWEKFFNEWDKKNPIT